eukprot:5823143-Pyramimonas_sp.AAC.2
MSALSVVQFDFGGKLSLRCFRHIGDISRALPVPRFAYFAHRPQGWFLAILANQVSQAERVALGSLKGGLDAYFEGQVSGCRLMRQAVEGIRPNVSVGARAWDALEHRRAFASCSGRSSVSRLSTHRPTRHDGAANFHCSSAAEAPSFGGRKETGEENKRSTLGRGLTSNRSESLALSGNYIQALQLQEVSNFKPVLTAISKQELCKEAGLQIGLRNRRLTTRRMSCFDALGSLFRTLVSTWLTLAVVFTASGPASSRSAVSAPGSSYVDVDCPPVAWIQFQLYCQFARSARGLHLV